MSIDVDGVLGIRWLIPPDTLPLRLVLFRIIEVAGGPIHQDELLAVLKYYGIEPEIRSLQQRLSELVDGTVGIDFMVRRVTNATFVRIDD